MALASAPFTYSSYYYTLFYCRSRKEERRGTLIAHLNRGCHIINAYRPALQAVTETPSHNGSEEEGEWDINSRERRDGYRRPEIKWRALKEMRPEMRQPLKLEFSVRVLHNIGLPLPDVCPLIGSALCYISAPLTFVPALSDALR